MNPFSYLVSVLFELYILVFLLRFILQWLRADFHNPVSQFVVKVSNPLVRPLRRIIPGLFGQDMATLLIIVVLTFIEGLVLSLTGYPTLAGGMLSLSIWVVATLISLSFNIFIFALVIQAIISWINPGTYNPVLSLLYQLNEPLLRRLRRYIRPVAGFDMAFLAAIIGLQFLKMSLLYMLGIY